MRSAFRCILNSNNECNFLSTKKNGKKARRNESQNKTKEHIATTNNIKSTTTHSQWNVFFLIFFSCSTTKWLSIINKLWARNRYEKREKNVRMNWIPRFAATLELQSRVSNSCVWLLTSLSSSSPSAWMEILQATRSTHNMDSNMFPVNRWQCILILSANVIAINIDTFWMVLMLPMRACTPFLHCIQAICVTEKEERKQFSIEGTNIIKFMAEHNRYSGDWYLPCKQIQLFYDLHVCTCEL